MKLKTLQLGHIEANCYIISDDNGVGAVIDPGDFNSSLLSVISESAIKELKYIILTHGHFDHISGVGRLKEKYPNAQILIGAGDSYFLQSDLFSGAAYFGYSFTPCTADKLLYNGNVINVGNIEIKAFSVPGHSPGGMFFYIENENIMFTGDTLFKGSVGRTDLQGGNHPALMKSVKLLKNFPKETVLYPGHGESTTVEQECMYNFYLS